MDQSVGAADVDEGAEVRQADHVTVRISPGLSSVIRRSLSASRASRAAARLREDQPVAAAIHLDDLGHDRLADHLGPALVGGLALGPPSAGKADLRGRDEAAQAAELDDQAALVVAGDHAFEDVLASPAGFGLHASPALLQPGPARAESLPSRSPEWIT